jgi:hypothetical protein
MPAGTRLPSLGVKDAGMIRQELAGEMLEITARVDLVGFVNMTADGAEAICGTTGVCQLLDAATVMLTNNRLGLADVQRVEIGPDTPTELFQADNNQWIVKLVRTLVYTLERAA